jgi:hypothetical protein
MNNDRVYNQTTEEWLAEYDTGVVKPAEKTRSQRRNLILVFDHHRTAKAQSGSVILSFIDLATREEYVAFFNADLTWQRGSRKGQQKTTGLGAPFYPPERGNFRKWWISTFNTEPQRWSTVHKALKNRLKGLQFTGLADISHKKNGQPFHRVKGLVLLKPQLGNNFGTSREQLYDIPC